MSPAPSILFVGNFLNLSKGTRAISEDLSRRLAGRGWTVARTSSRENRALRLVDMLQTVWRARRDFDIAVIDVYSGPAFRYAECVSWLLRRASKRYVLTLHGGNLPAFAARHPSRVRRLLAHASAVTTPSRYLQSEMAAYRSRLQLIPNPIDVAAYRARTRKQADPKIVWLRAFHRTYNPSLAISAVAAIRDRFPSVELTMIGPDKGDGSLDSAKAKAAECGVESHIKFLRAIPKHEVPAFLSQADIFLNTTNVDNTPVSVLEAMASGLCIVSTNVGGLPYLLSDEHDALLVEPGNPAAAASALQRILGNPVLAESLSAHARQNAQRFDWSCVLPQWEELLRNAVRAA